MRRLLTATALAASLLIPSAQALAAEPGSLDRTVSAFDKAGDQKFKVPDGVKVNRKEARKAVDILAYRVTPMGETVKIKVVTRGHLPANVSQNFILGLEHRGGGDVFYTQFKLTPGPGPGTDFSSPVRGECKPLGLTMTQGTDRTVYETDVKASCLEAVKPNEKLNTVVATNIKALNGKGKFVTIGSDRLLRAGR